MKKKRVKNGVLKNQVSFKDYSGFLDLWFGE